jgi:hypothetical protein
LIGKTALALVGLAAMLAASVLLVWSAGAALYFSIEKPLGPAGAAGIVALTDFLLLALGFGISHLMSKRHDREEEKQQEEQPAPSLMGLFADAVKDRPLTALLVSAVTGFAAVKNPHIFKELLGDVLRPRRN